MNLKMKDGRVVPYSKELKEGRILYFREDNSEIIAILEYYIENNILHIVSTRVNEEYQGLSLAKSLVEDAVSIAEKLNLEIASFCPYASHYLEKTNQPRFLAGLTEKKDN